MNLIDINKSDWNKYVGLLTIEQKNLIEGKLFSYYSYFNPIQDYYGNWVISIEEISYCFIEEFIWIKNLELIIYVPKEPVNPFI